MQLNAQTVSNDPLNDLSSKIPHISAVKAIGAIPAFAASLH